jgi:phosphate transport system substrate-binding protein
VYAKEQHIGMIPGIEEFLEELTSPTAIGREGYLSLKGLIPLPERK